MRKTNKIIIAVTILSVMLLGIGYAAIQNITLNISGNVSADPSQANFIVKFMGTPQVSDADKVKAEIKDDTNAKMDVEGLSAKGDIVTATYTVKNESEDLSADLTVETTNNNEEYFEISSKLGKTSLVAGEETTLVITVEVIKTPIDGDKEATIGLQLTSVPVQPGQEGSTNSGSGTGGEDVPVETTTLASVTTANIGEYIDLGNNLVGTASTKDDWRILYTDGNMVYAILADYLPNSTNYAKNAGLDTMGTYGVYSNISRDTLLTALTTSSNWSGLANEITGATVMGGPNPEITIYSYYAKTGILVDPSSTIQLDSSVEGYDIYVPQTSVVDNCFAFWFASNLTDRAGVLDCLRNTGVAGYEEYDNPYVAIRPVVTLPLDTVVTKGSVWTVTETGEGAGVEDQTNTEPVQTTLATVTNANIGEYIDLGNNIVGGASTADDWRILYAEEGKVYAILSDYLPNSTGYAKNAGLDISKSETEDYTYSVYSKTNRDTLLNGITTESNWEGLANGINGATVTGSPDAELMFKSYNKKYGTTLDYTTYPTLEESYLYNPHTDYVDECYGYWLASPSEGGANYVWRVNYSGYVYDNYSLSTHYGLRPVVCLSSDINAVKNGKLWTVVK